MDISRIERQLDTFLSPERLTHTMQVCDIVLDLARVYKVSLVSAKVAALCHDVLKSQDPTKVCSLGVELSEYESRLYDTYPAIWHSLCAPPFLKQYFNIDDDDILGAVQWHSTGKANMSLLEKILFVSDYIEPNRSFKDVPFIRDLAYKNLDQATFSLSLSNLHSLLKRGCTIHPFSIECYNYYLTCLPEVVSDSILTTYNAGFE